MEISVAPSGKIEHYKPSDAYVSIRCRVVPTCRALTLASVIMICCLASKPHQPDSKSQDFGLIGKTAFGKGPSLLIPVF